MRYEEAVTIARRMGGINLSQETQLRLDIHACLEMIAERLHAEGVLDVPGLRRFHEELKEAGL